jgi:DNA-binding winged helix-turn-helix (wHTH) protein
VLPVRKIAENGYQIQFASQFTFKPDSLVNIIHRTIKANHLPSDYIVNVIACASNETIFGYAILEAKKTNVIPCRGRQQSKDCYLINISFQETALFGLPKKSVTTGISLFALVLIFSGANIYYKKKSITNNPGKNLEDKSIGIGKYRFYHDKQHLIHNNEQIELTHKESKLLFIFASTPNEIIDRNRLQKEIWEDEGIIVGRSLDVFISKLRKKLENDSTVKLVNIHGKGYKLETSS